LRTVSNAHVLVVPSWYHTREQPVHGTFFREQAIAVQKLGVRIGVVFPDLRTVVGAQAGDWVSRRFQVVEGEDEGLFTMRVMGWRIPRAKKKTGGLWVSQVQRLIKRYVRRRGVPDLVHAQCVHEAGVAALAAKQEWKIPYLVTEHFTGYARGIMTDDMLARARDVFTQADRVVTVSQALAHDIRGYAGSQDIKVIPNLVDTDYFVPPPESRPHDPFRFLFVGFLTEKKGVADLLRSFAGAFGANDGVRLEIGGDGELRSALEALAVELGVGGRVDFLGSLSRDKVRQAMWRANAVVSAARVETFGVVLIEAMSTGLPVIVTRCGGPEEFVMEDVGRLVPLDDNAGMQKAMLDMVSTYGAWQAAAPSIRSYAVSNFGEDTVGFRLVEAYNSVIRQT
jgi:glycosyltransferase involved in cell wall biosynthesis